MDCTLWSSSQLCCNNRPCDAMLNCIERLCTFYIQHRVPMPAMERTSFSLMALSLQKLSSDAQKKPQTKSATNTQAQFQHIILSSTESCLSGGLLIAIRPCHIVSKLQALVKENSGYFFRQYWRLYFLSIKIVRYAMIIDILLALINFFTGWKSSSYDNL